MPETQRDARAAAEEGIAEEGPPQSWMHCPRWHRYDRRDLQGSRWCAAPRRTSRRSAHATLATASRFSFASEGELGASCSLTCATLSYATSRYPRRASKMHHGQRFNSHASMKGNLSMSKGARLMCALCCWFKNRNMRSLCAEAAKKQNVTNA